jgi:conserved oligomeric Golgi complex subunit 3
MVTLPLVGDLFLIRHLLILREQLVPFEIKLRSRHVEKKLDFRPTSLATQMLTNAGRSMLRLDHTNSLMQWARDGLPGVEEMTLDAKQELDITLKNACYSFKTDGLKMLMGPLEGLVIKINAFVDESITSTPPSNNGDRPSSNTGMLMLTYVYVYGSYTYI